MSVRMDIFIGSWMEQFCAYWWDISTDLASRDGRHTTVGFRIVSKINFNRQIFRSVGCWGNDEEISVAGVAAVSSRENHNE
jgi:hypothetical protein